MADPVASTADTELLARVEQVLAPTFELDREVGRGGMGIVYLARDRRLKRPVAIKVLPPELAFRSDIRSRFLREAETAAQLSHAHIVPIFTVDERGGLVYFVMAYVEGETLAQRLQREGRIQADESRRLLSQVASALAYAHSRGVIHRDIKPDNILLAADGGQVMVTDFGIARAVSTGNVDSRLTATGVAIGTPAYMSPEQCAGDREIDGRSDLYSLGVVGYQMLTGTVPFTGSGTGALLVKHISERPVPVTTRAPDVPPWLGQVIMRLLEKQPAAGQWAPGPEVRPPEIGRTVAGAPPSQGAAALAAAPGAGVPWTLPSERDLARWSAPAVVKFRRKLVKWGIAAAICIVISIFSADTDLLGLALAICGYLAWRYGKLWSDGDGYDWRDVLKQPRDRLFFDVAAESIDSARALFDKDKRAAARARLRGSAAQASPPWAPIPAGAAAPGMASPFRPSTQQPSPAPAPFAPFAPLAPPGPVGPPPFVPSPAPLPSRDAVGGLVPTEVLNSVHGPIVRRAVEDRGAVRQEVGRLGPADRALLPDVVSTVDALVERIASLAIALHRLDGDLSPDALPELDKRIAGAEGESTSTPDRERKLGLLRRQRATLQDLADRRATLSSQLENAGLVLRNIRYDLVRLRSAGVQSAIDDVASATQEARALSREIAHVLNAAEELKTV